MWHAAGLAAAGVLALVSFDEPVRQLVQSSRAPATDALEGAVRPLGEWPFYAGLPAALLVSGALAGHDGLLGAGLETTRAALVTMGLVTALKRGIGRARPLCDCGPAAFSPLAGPGRSLPSGHTAAAFAIATVLARRTDRGWMRVAYYSAASLVGWSRVNDNRHWLSDVVAGALVGTAAARLGFSRPHAARMLRPEIHLAGRHAAIGMRLVF
jgi:membrane-associated phospholipid phosphatase